LEEPSGALSRLGAIAMVFLLALLSLFAVYLSITFYNRLDTCNQTSESEVYLTVLNDSTGTGISGVQVGGSVKWLCASNSPPGYFAASENLGILHTYTNGTVWLGTIIGNYTLTLHDLSHFYTVRFSPGAEQTVNVTVGLPSARMTVVGCVFGSKSNCFNETGD
jgi:hypothetical protein